MRPFYLLEQGARNVVAYSWLSAIVGLAVGVVTCLGIIFSGVDVWRIVDQGHQSVLRGQNAVLVSSDNSSTLDAGRCDALMATAGVRTAGAIVASQTVTTGYGDGESWRLLETTPGYLSALWPEEEDFGSGYVYAGAEIADRYGWHTGIRTSLSDGYQTRVVRIQVMKSTERDPGADRMLAEAVAARGRVGGCLVEADSGAVDGVSLVLVGWFSPEPVMIAPIAATGDQDPQLQFHNRLTRWVPLVSGIAAAAAILGFWRIRSQELAFLSLLLGRARSMGFVLGAEWIALVLWPQCIGSIVVLLALQPLLYDAAVLGTVATAGLQALCISAAALPAGAFYFRPDAALRKLRVQ